MDGRIRWRRKTPSFLDEDTEDAVNVLEFLQRKYNDCEFLEVDSNEEGSLVNSSSGVIDQHYNVLEDDLASRQVSNGDGVKDHDYEVSEVGTKSSQVDNRGGVTDLGFRLSLKIPLKFAKVRPLKCETPLYSMNPDHFPNDVAMQRQIHRAKITARHHTATAIKQHIMEKAKKVRDLRKLNGDLNAKIDVLRSLRCICSTCERSRKVNISEVLITEVAKVPPLDLRFRNNTGKLSSSPCPSSSTSFTETGNREVLSKLPFENSANANPISTKIWKPDLNVAEKNKFSGRIITLQSPFCSTDSKGVTYLSQLRVSQEQKQKVQNIVGLIQGTAGMGPWKYGSPTGPPKHDFANNVLSPSTSIGLKDPSQTPATSPPISNQFFRIYKRV